MVGFSGRIRGTYTRRVYAFITVILGAICSIFLLATAQANIPGGSGGSFAVTDGGAASYSIPIIVPSGTAGMEPNLSISYNSQAGNGILGEKWILSGISAIERCPRTIAQDGIKGGVLHDLNDRYCYEGQRLISISGTYGGHGIHYRTEIDNFARITSYNYGRQNINGGTHPSSFKIETKDGRILWFGLTLDAMVMIPGKNSIHKWMLRHVQDRKGNYYTINYSDAASLSSLGHMAAASSGFTDGNLPYRIDYT